MTELSVGGVRSTCSVDLGACRSFRSMVQAVRQSGTGDVACEVVGEVLA